MTQKVLQIGSSAGVTISKDTLKTLGLKIGDQVVVSVDEQAQLINIGVAKRKSHANEKIAKLTLRFIERYRSDLEALAHK